MTLADLPTPCVVIERSRLLNNIARMQEAATQRGVKLRPHSKTHKSPKIAQWQIEKGAVGICCAKLGEAEVMAETGIEDIRLPYPLNPINAKRLMSLMDRTRVSFIVDHLGVARAWSKVMTSANRKADVLVKVDVGFHRCGIDPTFGDAIAFLLDIAALPGLRFRGLLTHAGHGYHAPSEARLKDIAVEEARTLRDLAGTARAAGVEIEEISAGATPTARFSLEQEGLTEYRPGNYVFFDRTQVGLGAATMNDCAMSVLATVVTKPSPERIILDSGSKTLSSDAARGFMPLPGHGVIFHELTPRPDSKPDANLFLERLSEEHATVRVASERTPLEPGDRVRIVPNHACVVANLVDELWLVDGDAVVEALPVAARGKIT